MKNYFLKINNTILAQSTIEFAISLVLAVLFLFLSCNVFVWMNHNIVQRQKDYEATRLEAGNVNDPGRADFYTHYKPLRVFETGGYKK
jgi:hypothetical protein